MGIGSYLRSAAPQLALLVLADAVAAFVLGVAGAGRDTAVLVLAVVVLGEVAATAADYLRKRAFYQELVNEARARLFDPKDPFGEHYVVLSGHTHIGSKKEKGQAVPYWQYTVGRLREDLTLERVDGAGASSDPVFCASKILRGEQVDVREANKVPAVRYSELVCGSGLVSEGEERMKNPRRSGYSYHGALLRGEEGSKKLDRFDLEIVAENEEPETCTYRTERWVPHKEDQRGEKCDAVDTVTDGDMKPPQSSETGR